MLVARKSLAFGPTNALIPCVWCPRDVELVVDLVTPVLVYLAVASKMGFAGATDTVLGTGIDEGI